MRSIKDIDLYHPENLVNMLETNGCHHNNYYHYTNLSSVVSMARSGKFHLSLGDRMNDGNEIQKGSRKLWDRLYIGSFNFGGNENMGLWGLYSLPWQDGVRIDIPKATMLKWLEELQKNKCIYDVKWDGTKKSYTYTPLNTSFELGLTDVVYAENMKSGNSSLKLKNNDNIVRCNYRIDHEKEMTGYIKNSVWEYENEVRIRALVEYALHKDVIAVDFPEDIFSQITIWACPWFVGDIQSRIEEEIEFPFKNERQSSFSRLVDKMKNSCSMCAHGKFESKK